MKFNVSFVLTNVANPSFTHTVVSPKRDNCSPLDKVTTAFEPPTLISWLAKGKSAPSRPDMYHIIPPTNKGKANIAATRNTNIRILRLLLPTVLPSNLFQPSFLSSWLRSPIAPFRYLSECKRSKKIRLPSDIFNHSSNCRCSASVISLKRALIIKFSISLFIIILSSLTINKWSFLTINFTKNSKK